LNFKLVLIGLLLVLFSAQTFALSDTNLVAWWNFDETSGTTLIDVKGYDLNGTNTNATINQTGKIKKAYSFNGSNSSIQLSNESSFDFLTTNNAEFSFSFWAKYGNIPAYSAFFTKSNNGSTNGISFRVDNGTGTGSTGWVLLMYTGTPVPHNRLMFYETNSGTNDNQWHNFVGTCKNNNCEVYIDGIKRNHLTSHLGSYIGTNNDSSLHIGSINGSNGFFSGLIDEMSIWNKVLSQTEIDELYNSGNGMSYPFLNNASFSYTINVEEEKIYLTDTTVLTEETVVDWNWLVDGLSISTDQNTSFVATESTDYNVCLIVNDGNFSTCQTINSGEFYGEITFNIYDEATGALLNDSTISVTPDINGVSNWVLTDSNTLTIDLTGITTGTYAFTLTKTGYSTRYYTTDLNQYTKLDVNFALLPTTSTKEIQFRFYKPDQITAYSNAYVEIRKPSKSYILGRLKTDATGLVTFNLDQNSSGLQFDMNNSENTYNSVVLTINKPKDEQTLIDINANWSYNISGLASYTDSNATTATKIFAIYSNTVNTYSVLIGSTSTVPTYTTRKYDIQVFGDTNTYTLQPYLINTTDSIQTTIFTINPYTNQAISDVTIKVYRTLPLTGRTLIEQTITDSKGQSIVYLVLNQTYSFEISVGTTTIRTETYTITGTSSTIYFKVDPGYDLSTTPMQTSIYSFWTPGKSSLNKADKNISANVSYGTNKNSITVSSIILNCYNNLDLNQVLLFQDSFGSPTMNFIQTYDFNLTTKTINSVTFDTNYSITCNIYTTLSDGNLIVSRQTYTMNNDDPQTNIGTDLRPFFGCSPTTDPNLPCPSMILAAVFITMMVITGIMIESGFTQPEFAGILFLIGLGFFTFFTWIPPVLYVIMLVIGLLIYVALGVRRI
jgi:predicted transcriptional regulator YdeE